MSNVALILPTRGLIQSRTVEFLLGVPSLLCVPYFSHSRPIPDCFNEPIGRALADGHDYIWILEEDVVPPHDALETLLRPLAEDHADITFFDYGMANGTDVTARGVGGRFTLSGTGCLATTARVMRALYPFDSRTAYRFPQMTQLMRYSEQQSREKVYGRHDIDFFVRVQTAGYRILEVGRAQHLKVKEYGKPGVNNGFHKIEVID